MSDAIAAVRDATRGTPFEDHLFLVGGVPRDRLLGLPVADDVDLVTDLDALDLAQLLHRSPLSEHAPVVYPRFGTARLTLAGCAVELVTARAENYDAGSRKPNVRRAGLMADALRRDFTINTLMEGLHSGETLDLTGRGLADLRAGEIRTPLEPRLTFYDDPLRMLRAVRFAVRFGFTIEPATWQAMREEWSRLDLLCDRPVVSAERIRDEFCKTLMLPNASRGLALLMECGLLAAFAPELSAMVGVTQNSWHIHDVWSHTLAALAVVAPDADLDVRIAVLLHDVGKPPTRGSDERGIHFYEHPTVGADLAGRLLHRLRFSTHDTERVTTLVKQHMRLGEARPEWSDAAIRRLVRDTGDELQSLFDVAACDLAAMNPEAPVTDLRALRARIDEVNGQYNAAKVGSPLTGRELMDLLGLPPGRDVGRAKAHLVELVLDGSLAPDDTDGARKAAVRWRRAEAGGEAP
ncbi:MAG: HD domain-containing protein [Armatimonadetes bacterium]|nr:HD domain-containing protein [Armatimonadota bacterium]